MADRPMTDDRDESNVPESASKSGEGGADTQAPVTEAAMPESSMPGAPAGEPRPPRAKTPWGSVLLVILIAGAVIGYMVWGTWHKESEPAVATVLKCVTTQCAETETRPMVLGESIPAHCAVCGKESMYPSFKCPSCGTRNVLKQTLGQEGPSVCSKCGGELDYGDR